MLEHSNRCIVSSMERRGYCWFIIMFLLLPSVTSALHSFLWEKSNDEFGIERVLEVGAAVFIAIAVSIWLFYVGCKGAHARIMFKSDREQIARVKMTKNFESFENERSAQVSSKRSPRSKKKGARDHSGCWQVAIRPATGLLGAPYNISSLLPEKTKTENMGPEPIFLVINELFVQKHEFSAKRNPPSKLQAEVLQQKREGSPADIDSCIEFSMTTVEGSGGVEQPLRIEAAHNSDRSTRSKYFAFPAPTIQQNLMVWTLVNINTWVVNPMKEKARAFTEWVRTTFYRVGNLIENIFPRRSLEAEGEDHRAPTSNRISRFLRPLEICFDYALVNPFLKLRRALCTANELLDSFANGWNNSRRNSSESRINYEATGFRMLRGMVPFLQISTRLRIALAAGVSLTDSRLVRNIERGTDLCIEWLTSFVDAIRSSSLIHKMQRQGQRWNQNRKHAINLSRLAKEHIFSRIEEARWELADRLKASLDRGRQYIARVASAWTRNNSARRNFPSRRRRFLGRITTPRQRARRRCARLGRSFVRSLGRRAHRVASKTRRIFSRVKFIRRSRRAHDRRDDELSHSQNSPTISTVVDPKNSVSSRPHMIIHNQPEAAAQADYGWRISKRRRIVRSVQRLFRRR